MKFLFMSILMLGVGIGVVGCEDDESSQDDVVETEQEVEEVVVDTFEITGHVLFNALSGPDGANGALEDVVDRWFIRGDDGVSYFPDAPLPSGFEIAGLRVWVLAEDLNSSVGSGKLIRIIQIERE